MADEPMTTPQSTNQGIKENNAAAVYMTFSVLFFSFVPLAISLSRGSESPFLLNTGWRLGVAVGCFLFLSAIYWRLLSHREIRKVIRQRIVSRTIFWATIGNLSYAIFAVSTRFIDVSIAAVLFETWPIGFIVYMAWRYRHADTYRKNLRAIAPLLAIALAGFVFLVVSQTGEFGLNGAAFGDLVQGAGLALFAALVGGIGAASTIEWGRGLASRLPVTTTENIGSDSLSFFGAILGIAIGNLFAMVLNASFVPLSGEPIAPQPVIIGIVSGLVLQAPAAMLLRKSNLVTHNLGVNALGYAIPVVSLAWLWLFSEIAVARVDYLIIGTAAIVAVNLLVNFEAERLLGFKVLVIALWACGTLVYLRDATSWGWAAKSNGYFDVLFLSATVFALILSFRTQRLASRTQEEDNRAFKVFRELEELERRGVISPEAKICEHILTIDEKQGRDLENAYSAARRAISDALGQDDCPDREKLIAVSVKLDALAHSRQQGINFGEICALFIFAGLVVGTALLSRPGGVSGLTGFLVEMFAMLFPAVILFLAFNVLDLQRGRVFRILVSNSQYGGYGVAFQDTESQGGTIRHTSRRFWEQLISVVVGLVLILAYAWLFLNKWEVWPLIVAWFTGLLS